ncbi:MAG: hypothetical protein QOH58_2525 [Thermoleophilaceae bacterium]|jgi:hypothetical protein|nr:hypothetical protein [Thermoleophilaceae bacterium]
MRDRPELALAAVLGLALAVLLTVGLTDRRDEAFTLGVQPAGVVELKPGERACQEGIDVPADFSSVELQVGTFRREGSPLEVTVHERTGSGRLLGRGVLAGGYPDVSRQRADVGRVEAGQRVAVCVEARGPRKVGLYGNVARAAPGSTLRAEGRPVDADLTLVFHGDERSVLGELPDMLSRAALFKAGWAGAWTFWLLTLAVVALVPLALGLAVRSLRRDSGG